MQSTNYSRKLEKTGRLMIPSKLREEMGMIPGEEYSFSILTKDGHKYICIDCGIPKTKTSLEEAMRIVQESGMRIVQNDS